MNQFDDIRPYNDEEVVPTIQRLLKDKEFLKAIAKFRFPRLPNFCLGLMSPAVQFYLKQQVKSIRTVDDLQKYTERYLCHMIKQTTTGVTVSGEDYLDRDKAHLFISNHRDIAVDPAMVNWVLYHRHYHTLHIAIGDNLLTKPYVSDLMRLNKCFIVNRSATKPREKLKAAKHLSSYIHHAIVNEGANIWIAQREGRAKDGIDRTNSAVIGMLALSKPRDIDFGTYIRELNIVPVSISYENDPCDIAKSYELYSHQVHGNYEKEEHEDAHSIARGITGYKGRVHVAFGKPLNGEYESTDDIVAELDQAIISNYVLHPSNCIAYQELHGQLPESITVTDTQAPFQGGQYVSEIQHFHQRLSECDERYRDILLSMYANPIVSQQSLHD